jgi:23S rRNA (uracil1939-C5)-methyltransferase
VAPGIDAGTVAVEVTGIAGGGDGVGHLADGRVVFVRGGLPGDRGGVRLVEERSRFARGFLVDVTDPAPGRIAPPCPNVALGCGGCGWQHVDHATQRHLKATIVIDALVRIGRLEPAAVPEPQPGPDLAPTAFRTTVRAAVDAAGHAGFRVHHGHDHVPVSDTGCLVAHPLVDEVLRLGRFAGCSEVTVRAGAATGERVVVADPGRGAVELPELPSTTLVGADELRSGHRVWFHEVVAGRRWRVSARSFFQARPDGAEALADVVADPVLADAPRARAIADLYAGVGLFAGVLADRLPRRPQRIEVVEANRGAVADARLNLAGVEAARLVTTDVRRWRPSAVDVVVADPSRHGLGSAAADRIVATGAGLVVLVSCDAGALGRDAGLLDRAGYRLEALTLVDLFPHTPHVEVVSTWRRPRHPDGGAAT